MRPISQEVGHGVNLLVFIAGVSLQGNPPEFRFSPSTLRNFVPTGAAHEAAAGQSDHIHSDTKTRGRPYWSASVVP